MFTILFSTLNDSENIIIIPTHLYYENSIKNILLSFAVQVIYESIIKN